MYRTGNNHNAGKPGTHSRKGMKANNSPSKAEGGKMRMCGEGGGKKARQKEEPTKVARSNQPCCNNRQARHVCKKMCVSRCTNHVV